MVLSKNDNVKGNVFDSLYVVFGLPCLFMMMVTSRGFTEIKTILLGVTCLISAVELFVLGKKIEKKELAYFLIFVVYFFFSMIIGVANGFPFSLFGSEFSLVQYYIITPISIFLGYMIFKDSPTRTKFLIKVVLLITVFIVFMDVAKILSFKGVLPNIDYFDLIMIANDAAYSDKLELRVSNEHMLMYLMPFYIILMIQSENVTKSDKIAFAIIFVLGTIYSILSGRKALELIILFATFFSLVCKSIMEKKTDIIPKFFVVLVVVLLLGNKFSELLGMDNIFHAAYKTLENGLAGDSYGVTKRSQNTEALFDLWYHSPIWGNGLNSFAETSIANTRTKWSYEVVYFALLAQSGIIGICILLAGVFSVVKRNFINFMERKSYIYMASMFACVMFFLAGNSNPFVFTVWPWVVSLAIGNQKGLS